MTVDKPAAKVNIIASGTLSLSDDDIVACEVSSKTRECELSRVGMSKIS